MPIIYGSMVSRQPGNTEGLQHVYNMDSQKNNSYSM